MKVDILIKNGHVIDTSANVNGTKNIGIMSNRIVDVADGCEAVTEIDASGHLVLPGLIDYHAHICQSGTSYGANPDAMIATGVTAVVDGGSCGYANYDAFHREASTRNLRIKSNLSIFAGGYYEIGIEPNYDPATFNEMRIRETIEKYGEEIVALKIMLSEHIVHDLGITPLVEMIKIAEKVGKPVCVHTTNPPCTASEIASLLRKGDIYCHCFQGTGDPSRTIVDESGKVYPAVKEARMRGVLFDAANGRMHFSFVVAEKAMQDGFYPDVISTDIVKPAFNLFNFNRNLPFLMSKYLNMGMGLIDVVRAVSETPAKSMNMEGKIGTLRPGALADVTILQLRENQRVVFEDDNKSGSVWGDKLLVPMMTILDGCVQYSVTDFNLKT